MTISLVSLGHIDHGKSTAMGRLLYELGQVDEQVVKRIEKESGYARTSTKFPWAYLLDLALEERQTGNTADISFYPFRIN